MISVCRVGRVDRFSVMFIALPMTGFVDECNIFKLMEHFVVNN